MFRNVWNKFMRKLKTKGEQLKYLMDLFKFHVRGNIGSVEEKDNSFECALICINLIVDAIERAESDSSEYNFWWNLKKSVDA